MLRVEHLGVTTSKGERLLAPATFEVSPGRLVAVMGASGAGKSTLVEAIAGVSRHAVAGDVRVDGVALSAAARRERFGLSATRPCLLPELTGRQNLAVTQAVGGHADADVEGRCASLGLLEALDRPVGTLSTGQQKRLQLVDDLLHEPSLLLLDEPTTGLSDTDAIDLVRTLRQVVDASEVTILLVIHQPRAEVRALLDSVLLVARGEVVAHRALADVATGLPPAPEETAPLHWALTSSPAGPCVPDSPPEGSESETETCRVGSGELTRPTRAQELWLSGA